MVTLPGGRGLLRQLDQELFPHLSSEISHSNPMPTEKPKVQMILGS
jgi:hypothetical protein